MRPDARGEGSRWLEQAEADRRGAQLLFDGQSYYLACFVVQQVAEKALKAFIYFSSLRLDSAEKSLFSGKEGVYVVCARSAHTTYNTLFFCERPFFRAVRL